MKIAVASDIHLEFGDLFINNEAQADLLILGGDICVAADIGRPDANNLIEGARSSRIVDFFKRCSFQFPHVIMIMGNHEHYHGDFSKSYSRIKSMLESNMLNNIYLLEKETKVLDGYTFIGGTLWTDFNRGDPLTLHAAGSMMNDFRGVKHSAKGHAGGIWKFIPEDAYQDHLQMKGYIRTVIDNRREAGLKDAKLVVVGHHAPSSASTHPRYEHDHLMNGCFRSELDEFILDRPEICLWTHGHTHDDFDYMIGSTRVVCNPRGYINHESRADTWELKYVDI